MKNFEAYANFVTSFKAANDVSIDSCHGMLVFSLIVSHKPKRVLELGIGNGYTTKTILYALRYNGSGVLDTIDNFHDWGGNGSDPVIVRTLREIKELGASVYAPIAEKTFVFGVAENTYDFVVSDADHHHCGEWTDQIFRITRPNGIIVVHDVSSYTSPHRYVDEAKRLGKPFMVFAESSRKDETCANGIAVIHNTK